MTSTTNGITKFIYDGAEVVRDIDGSGSTTAEYLNSLELDDKLRQTTGTTASYFLSDHLGTTRTLVDTSGISVSALNYDSFGNLLGGSATSRYTYTGRELDSDSSVLFYRTRWYDPTHARFLTEDPIQLSGGLNLYAYVRNYPIGLKDPLGLQAAAAPAPAPAPPAIPPPVAGAGAGAAAEAGAAAGGGAAATGGVVVGGFALGWVIGRGIGHIPTGNGKTVDDRVQDWMIDHIWGRPDPGPSTKAKPICDATPKPEPRGRGKWRCEAKCHVNNFSDVPNAPLFVFGVGYGSSQLEACNNAKHAATQSAPLGTYARHCKCYNCSKL